MVPQWDFLNLLAGDGEGEGALAPRMRERRYAVPLPLLGGQRFARCR
jgi:hypothetical protein